MAIVEINFMSESLQRNVSIKCIIPDFSKINPKIKKFRSLYLLHGLLGNDYDWITNSNIKMYAEKTDIIVIMPSGENGFYIDDINRHSYYSKFIGEELVDYTRKLFPLSHNREHTFIGGLSMGGYGAFINGFKYEKTFSKLVLLSGAYIIDEIFSKKKESNDLFEDCSYVKTIFGKLNEVINSYKNPIYAISHYSKKYKSNTKIFIAIGLQDMLLKHNQKLRNELIENGFEVEYIESRGGHTWDFWDRYIKKFLKVL